MCIRLELRQYSQAYLLTCAGNSTSSESKIALAEIRAYCVGAGGIHITDRVVTLINIYCIYTLNIEDLSYRHFVNITIALETITTEATLTLTVKRAISVGASSILIAWRTLFAFVHI